MPESKRSNKITQYPGTSAAATDNIIEMVRLMNTVRFRPYSSVVGGNGDAKECHAGEESLAKCVEF